MRLTVAAFVLRQEDGLVYQSQVADATGYTASNVRQELDRLVDLSMVTKLPRTNDSKRQNYLRTESPLWRIIETALDCAGTGPESKRL